MVITEEYFPRGGKKPKVTFNEKKKFDFLGNSDRIGKKRKYKAPKNLGKDEDHDNADRLLDFSYDSDSDKTIKSVSAEAISLKTLREGMTIMGRVMSIIDTKIVVSLPGRLSGIVMACHISNSYTKMLQAFVNDEIEEMKKLPDLFNVGEYINVRVLSVVAKIGSPCTVTLSMMPQDVNSGITYNSIKEGSLLRAAVDSVEDHGYVIDLGITNCRSFLPKKFSDKKQTLDVGQVIWCLVKKCQKSAMNSIVTVSNHLEGIKSMCISGDKIQDYTVGDLKPGMAVDFFVNKPLRDGAEGSVLSKSTGYVHVSQIDGRLCTGQTVKARLLYTMPITNLPFFTTREVFNSFKPNLDEEATIKIGQIIPDAKVSKVTANSIVFKLNEGIAIMASSIAKKNHGGECNLQEIYPNGSEHRIRVVRYHPSDYAYICTDNKEIVEQKYFTLRDLSIGEIVEATVENVSDKGVSVKVGAVNGWIPEIHISDVALFQSSKPNQKNTTSLAVKKFKSGQQIVVRVMRINLTMTSLHLTAKASFLDPEIYPLSEYEDARVGYQYKAVIVQHLTAGVLVAFFGDLKAFVARDQLSHEFVKNIPAAFNIGLVVNCTIMSVDAENNKIFGSFISPGEIEKNKNKKGKKSKKRVRSEDIDIDSVPIEVKPKKRKNSENDQNESGITKKEKKKNISESISADTQDIPALEVKESKKNKKKKDKKAILEETVPLKETENHKHVELVENSKKSKRKNVDIAQPLQSSVVLPEENNMNKKKDKKKKKESKPEADVRKKSKRTIDNGNEDSLENNKKSKVDLTSNVVEKKKKIDKNVTKDEPEMKFTSISNFWDTNAASIAKNAIKNRKESSSESDAEVVAEPVKKKKKKLTVAEKVDKARSEEEKLRDIEKQLAISDTQPQSSDQFDRLLMANPNSSELWIAYMAFHLQATEIERARSIGKKAINTISFREEQDKLNVWLAMLNLENRFGTKESLTATLQEALQMNEPFNIHSKMLDMYADTGKVQELTGLIDLLVTKYRERPDTYSLAGEACYKMNLVDKARSVMQKAINRLDNKKHVPVLIKFAHMENNRGDGERAEALFEQIVGCLPQRVDVWCVYVDMLMKSQKLDNARLVLERAVSQKLPVRKMKILYKKWMDLEEKLGSIEDVERVRQLALEFIEKAK